jgi:hypothetical protein
MSSLIHTREREVSVLSDLATDIFIVDPDILITRGSESFFLRIVQRKTDCFTTLVIADVITVAWTQIRIFLGYGSNF